MILFAGISHHLEMCRTWPQSSHTILTRLCIHSPSGKISGADFFVASEAITVLDIRMLALTARDALAVDAENFMLARSTSFNFRAPVCACLKGILLGRTRFWFIRDRGQLYKVVNHGPKNRLVYAHATAKHNQILVNFLH
jgi:hypothetical protein